MKEHRESGESSSSSSKEDDQPSTTRQQEERAEIPSSSSEKDEASTTRQQKQNDVISLFCVGTNPSSSSEEDDQPSTTSRLQEKRAESPLSSPSEDEPSSTLRQEEKRADSSSSSSEENEPFAPMRIQEWRSEGSSSSSSEEDEPSTTRRQQQQSPVSFIEINLSTTLSQDGQSGGSPSSTSSSYEDDEPANSFLSIHLSARGNLGDARVKRKRERCEEMKNKNLEEERKTFGLLSRIYLWWLNRKIDRIAREIQSTVVDERDLLRHSHLSNSEKTAEKERLLDRRTELVVYKRRQEFKVEREVRKQRLKVKRTEEKVLKMENISELCDNPERPTSDRRRLNLYSI
ncbi:osteocalcin 2-like [Etheostoma cragini]|uniref:osteocalcin 2-like n=1 Tax=Etheostoma cragini TaxID=417921 RepID=UPI00155E2414|nr:osteocalcin 2-like [Etheostoma cragini]